MPADTTVRPARRVVRRARPAIDHAYEVIFGDLPPDPALRQAILKYADGKRSEYEARQALAMELSRANLRWKDCDPIVSKLVYG